MIIRYKYTKTLNNNQKKIRLSCETDSFFFDLFLIYTNRINDSDGSS